MTEMRDGTEIPRTLEERQVVALERIAAALEHLTGEGVIGVTVMDTVAVEGTQTVYGP